MNHRCLTTPVKRRATRPVFLGGLQIGGGAPVSVQSMTNTDTRDIASTLLQIDELARAGCDLVRVAVPDAAAANKLAVIVGKSPLPVVADIHFDHQLAVTAIKQGVHGIRINPGNITVPANLAEVARAAAIGSTVVRIGVNSGSLEKEVLTRHGGPTPQAMVESAQRACDFFEGHGCEALKVSLKTSQVASTVAACRLFAEISDLPLHLGVTEAGTPRMGIIKSAVGIGALLLDGIGDTIRVSLTASPVEEIGPAIAILEACKCRLPDPDIVSCPTCGRTEIDLVTLTDAVEKEILRLKRGGWSFRGMRIAVMGCVVNGPGEARDATLGIAGGRGKGAIFRAGQVVERVPEDKLVEVFSEHLRRIAIAPSENPTYSGRQSTS